jgi:hypothetical protein
MVLGQTSKDPHVSPVGPGHTSPAAPVSLVLSVGKANAFAENKSLDLLKDSSTKVGFEALLLWAQESTCRLSLVQGAVATMTLSFAQGTVALAARTKFWGVISLPLTKQDLKQTSSGTTVLLSCHF